MAIKTISADNVHLKDPAVARPGKEPRRVILRLRVNEFEGEGCGWEQFVDAIETYLVWAGRPKKEYRGDYQTRTHFAHVEPFQAPELNQTTFHVVLDVEQHSLAEVNFDLLPHEIYRVRRNVRDDSVVWLTQAHL